MAPQLGGGRAGSEVGWSCWTPDQRIVALACIQHGVVDHAQARRAGLDDDAIGRRVRSGRLHRVHRGVLAVGTPPRTVESRRAAALLAAGEQALLSHDDAGVLWGLVGARPRASTVEVTVPRERQPRRPGIRAHRTSSLHEEERRRVGGLAVTSPARTLVDLAARLDEVRLEATVADARRRGVLRDAELRRVLERAGRRRGVGIVRRMLAIEGGPAFTRSGAERLLVPALRGVGAPPFETNALLLGHEVDVLWRAERVVVEVDAYGTHGDPLAFEVDRARDGRLLACGYRVHRVTWRRLAADAEATARSVLAVLAAAR